jgi:hypothetical protein
MTAEEKAWEAAERYAAREKEEDRAVALRAFLMGAAWAIIEGVGREMVRQRRERRRKDKATTKES